jgi:UTP-glucose-1-phosphate uridylyltransferase
VKPTLVILAAGIGSRYGGLKQLDGVGPNGEPILEYSVYDAVRAGFGKLVFVIRPDLTDTFKEMVDRTFGSKIPVRYVYQELATMLPARFSLPPERQKPWGTGHALLCAEPAVKEPFSAINADDFYGATAFKLQADYLRSVKDSAVAEYAMVGYILRNTLSEYGTVSRGVCQVEGDYLRQVVELTKIEKDGRQARYFDETGQTHPLSGDELVSLNMWGFTPSIFAHLQAQFDQFLRERGSEAKSELYIPAVVDTLIAQSKARVRVLPSYESWFGVTYQEDKTYVTRTIQNLIAQGVYPERLWSDL